MTSVRRTASPFHFICTVCLLTVHLALGASYGTGMGSSRSASSIPEPSQPASHTST